MAKMEYQDLIIGSTVFRLFRYGMREFIKGTINDGHEDVSRVKCDMNSLNLKVYRACSISFIRQTFIGKFVLELNSKGLHQGSGNKKMECTNKRDAPTKLFCCCFFLANLNLLLLRRSR